MGRLMTFFFFFFFFYLLCKKEKKKKAGALGKQKLYHYFHPILSLPSATRA